MRQQFCFTALTLVFAFALPISSADEKKDETAKTSSNLDKLSIANELTGRVTKVSSQANAFTVRVEYLDLQPNASHRTGTAPSKEVQHLIKQQQELARIQAQITHTRNPARRMAKLQQFATKIQRQQVKANAQHLPYKVVTRHHDLQLLANEDVKVRLARPPADFDEQGNPSKQTPEELRKLKGPEKLWGYPGDWSNLQTGQMVKVFLGRKKNASAATEEAVNDDKRRSEVTRIYILEEGKKK
jgi:hypothetical protein